MNINREIINLIKSKISIGVLFTALFCIANSNLLAQNKTIEARVKHLLKQMTLEEKIGLTVGDGKFLSVEDSNKVED